MSIVCAITQAGPGGVEPRYVATLIAEGRFDLTDEKRCQAQMDPFLRSRLPGGVKVSREHRLGPGDIPDFLVDGRIVVECKKIAAPKRAIYRQLKRYAAYPEVAAIVLATGVAIGLPAQIEGKPALLVNLGRAWL